MIQGLPVLSNVVDLKQPVHALQMPIITFEEQKPWLKKTAIQDCNLMKILCG